MLYPNKYQSIIIELEENRDELIKASKLILKPFIAVGKELNKALKLLGQVADCIKKHTH